MVKLPEQKVLVLDVEWKPTLAYVWRPYDETITPEKIKEHGGLLCVGVKWLGDKQTLLFSEWEHGHEGMLAGVWEMMSVADAIVTYNGDKFDIPKLRGEFLQHGFPPPPPLTSIDVLKAVKKLGLFMNRLAFVGPFFELGGKLEHEGMALWTKVMDGDEKARKRMEKYCIQDVVLLEKLYLKMRPYIANHPHLGQQGRSECPACGGLHVQSRGTRRTRAYKIQRLQCQDCGSWHDGARSKVN